MHANYTENLICMLNVGPWCGKIKKEATLHMRKVSMNQFTILNYQGSKKNLIDFIHSNTTQYIQEDKAILDVFAGSCSVGYSFKTKNLIFANDSELYSYHISKALLGNRPRKEIDKIRKIVDDSFYYNYQALQKEHAFFTEAENAATNEGDVDKLLQIYDEYPTIWNKKVIDGGDDKYQLFSTYYAGSYFGIEQAFRIDSIRYAIENFAGTKMFSIMLSCLFYAMKESVFAKDGHMAQPLDPFKNGRKLLLQRKKNIDDLFWSKLADFYGNSFIDTNKHNRVYNLDFCNLLKKEEIISNVGFIYADPPYTDMQYSRYYHLLNIVSKYDYPKPSIVRGGFTKGLYTENRYQSELSKKGSSFKKFKTLVEFSNTHKKNLAISFAYPLNPLKQKTDRYVMSIQQIIDVCKEVFGSKNVDIASVEYAHSNNRNSEMKSVIEYLVLCRSR